MHQALETLVFRTDGTGLHEITGEIAEWLRASGIAAGVLTLFCQHTSAGLLITENASPLCRATSCAGSPGQRPRSRLRTRRRGARRHARAYQGRDHRQQPHAAGGAGSHAARHLAGRVPGRASPHAAPRKVVAHLLGD
jgi:hypothetical protein